MMLWNTRRGLADNARALAKFASLENACVFLASKFGEDGRHGASGRTRGGPEVGRRSAYALVKRWGALLLKLP